MDPPAFEVEEPDFWGACLLTCILSDPPRYELKLPAGQTLRLKASHFFNASAFSIAYIEATGAFPPLPQKKAGAYLQDLFRRLLEDKKDIQMPAEASNEGTLLADLRLAILNSPVAEDPHDIDRGGLFQDPEGPGAWVNARCLLAKVQRSCPVKFTPSDFYVAMTKAGLVNLEKRRADAWRGRVWRVPTDLLPVMDTEAAPANLLGQTLATYDPAH
jgi:hypothetical protein